MFIIATVEKYLLTKDHIKKLILTGADSLRLNLSYRTIEENESYISIIQQVSDELNASTKIFIDFPINKIRLGDFETRFFPVKENDEIIFKSSAFTFDCQEYVPVNTPNLGDKVAEGQSVTIGDGEISLMVTEIIDKDTVKMVAQNKGVIQYMKTFNLPAMVDTEKTLDVYTEIIKKIKINSQHYFAISYYDNELLEKISNLIKTENQQTKIVLKIEKEYPLEELKKICQSNYFDFLLIDRGELGVNMAFYKTGIYQKQIIKVAQKYKKPVILSTQILESTMNNFIPNRAEILDLTNSVLDEIQGIMLCRETAINSRAAYSVSVAKKIISEVEKYKEHQKKNS